MRSPLPPELTLLQSSELPLHSDAHHFHPVQLHPPRGLHSVEVRQAWLFLFLEARAGSTLEGQGWNIQRDGFPSHPYWCQYTPLPCCLPPHPKGGKNQCDRLDLMSRLEPRSPAALPTIT